MQSLAITNPAIARSLREGCVDELLLYYAPFWMGDGIGMVNLPTLESVNVRENWKFIDQQMIGGNLWHRAAGETDHQNSPLERDAA